MDNQLEKQTKQNIIHFEEGIPGLKKLKTIFFTTRTMMASFGICRPHTPRFRLLL